MNMICIFLLSVVALSTAYHGQDHGYMTASCNLYDPTSKNSVYGQLNLYQKYGSQKVWIRGRIYELSPGLHGFHVHAKGNVRQNCTSAGGHFNPFNNNHGAPYDAIRHVGDLGNVEANMFGVADINIVDYWISLEGTSDRSILNRAIVIHAGVDDLGRGGDAGSLKTGNAGGRLGCCQIKAA
ncbi:superoxide dismutase [Cu-Zn]-like [Mytilus californianus]|uniref:superoxide dismutase [Cu-Zn]-like n=1 Tax=Mytilus californianus TaxID=6549 RepID=UPI0022466FEB|nr:superoxide dismutase [Cu-Zn]-like [Mytilus californianus]